MGANELNEALWVDRAAMENLLYKMETMLLMVSAGRTEWIGNASNEVEEAIQSLGKTRLHSQVMIDDLAAEWGLETPATLGTLVSDKNHQVWAELLNAHREHITELEARIKAATTAARTFTTQGMISAQEALAVAGFNADRSQEPGTRILDTAL